MRRSMGRMAVAVEGSAAVLTSTETAGNSEQEILLYVHIKFVII